MKHQIGRLGGRDVTNLTFIPDCRRAGVRIPLKMGDCDLSPQAEDESVILFLQLTLPKICI